MNVKDFLSQLEGIWSGTGRGEYPTILPFEYTEALRIVRLNSFTLQYDQKTMRFNDEMDNYVPSHQESGFIHLLQDEQVLINNSQSGGRTEVLTGTIESTMHRGIVINVQCEKFLNDDRLIETSRIIEINNDILHYQMYMTTNSILKSSIHLDATLHKNQ